MVNMLQGFAELICYGDAILNPKKWLAEEASNLATRIPHLDEIPPQAILPLAMLVANGECNVAKLVHRTDIDKDRMVECLEALCEFEFAEKTWDGYKSTQAGEQAFEVIGKTMVTRELFEIGRRLDQLKGLSRLIEADSTR